MVQQRLRQLWQRCLQQRRCLASVEGAACLFVWCAHINSFSCTLSRRLHWLARSAETGTSVAFPMVWSTPCPDGLDGVKIMLDGCTQCLMGALIQGAVAVSMNGQVVLQPSRPALAVHLQGRLRQGEGGVSIFGKGCFLLRLPHVLTYAP